MVVAFELTPEIQIVRNGVASLIHHQLKLKA